MKDAEKPKDGFLLKRQIYTLKVPQVCDNICLLLFAIPFFFSLFSQMAYIILCLGFVKVGGGSNIFVKVRWSQKLQYQENRFFLSVPFSFQPYVIPVGMKVCKREKIQLTVNSGVGLEIFCESCSHPLKVFILFEFLV